MRQYSFKFSILIILLFLSSLSSSRAATNAILVLGDSLSAAYQMPPNKGWVALLDQKLKSNHPDTKVINSSIVGETTDGGLRRLPALLEHYHPTIVIIELGGNDGLRGIPINVIQANLQKLIELSLAASAKVLLFAMELPPNYGESYIKPFVQGYSDLSKKNNITLVPFFLQNVALKKELMLEDGIHPAEKAQPLLLENIYPYLEPLL